MTTRQYAKEFARSGGHARAAKLTKAQRMSSARKAGKARWADCVEFHDPHPGMVGCVAPLPEPLRALAASLSGKRESLAVVLRRIEATTCGGFWTEARNWYILIFQGNSTTRDAANCWRLLRYRNVKPRGKRKGAA